MTVQINRLSRTALANPLFLSLLSFVLGILFLYIDAAKFFIPLVSTVFQNIGSALIVAATFGVLFEYFGKAGLINDSVKFAVGQSRSSSLGVTNFVNDVTRIDHRDSIRSSSILSVSSRYSSLFLESHRRDIYERLSTDQNKMQFVRMKDASQVPHGQGPTLKPEEFFKNLAVYDPAILGRVEVFETDRLLSYNYAKFDSGIWIKLYLNSAGIDTPPAFFVSRGTPLYEIYCSDIDRLLAGSIKVAL